LSGIRACRIWQDRCSEAAKSISIWATEIKEDAKKEDDAKKLRSLQLTERDVDYIKTPLVYETTGAFGLEAKKCSARITATRSGLQVDSRRAGRGLGCGCTWSANPFAQWWARRLAMAAAPHVAACAWQAGICRFEHLTGELPVTAAQAYFEPTSTRRRPTVH